MLDRGLIDDADLSVADRLPLFYNRGFLGETPRRRSTNRRVVMFDAAYLRVVGDKHVCIRYSGYEG